MYHYFFSVFLCLISGLILVPLVDGNKIPFAYECPIRVQELTNHSNQDLTAYRIGFKYHEPNDDNHECQDLPSLSLDVSSNLEILFDKKKKAAKQIRYEVNFNKIAVKIDNCNSININEEILNGDDMGACIKKRNQKNILDDTSSSISSISVTNEDHRDIDSLIMQPLIPQEDFQDEISSLTTSASCLISAPMWKSVAEGAWKQVIDKELTIITGTYDVPRQQTLVGKEKGNELREQPQMDYESVPRAFWTLVINKLPPYGALFPNDEYYGMILVTVNKNNFPKGNEEHICMTVSCLDMGWMSGEKEGITDPLNYCCKFSKENLNELNIKINELYYTFLNLNLKRFYHSRNHEGSYVSTNVLKLMFNKEPTKSSNEDRVSVAHPSS